MHSICLLEHAQCVCKGLVERLFQRGGCIGLHCMAHALVICFMPCLPPRRPARVGVNNGHAGMCSLHWHNIVPLIASDLHCRPAEAGVRHRDAGLCIFRLFGTPYCPRCL